MPANIIDGKALAAKIQLEITAEIKALNATNASPPRLAVVLMGNDPASEVYVRNKLIACQKVGIESSDYRLPATTTQASLEKLIDELNLDPTVHGILIQLPLPSKIDSTAIVEKIAPHKDVDGFHPYNLGRLAQKHSYLVPGKPDLRPCTPAGIMKLLEQTGVSLKGLNATVIGVSNIVGRPMLLELLRAGCTITACHRETRNLKNFVEQADILVSATGNLGLVKSDWIKPGAIVIDVGMNRLSNGHLVGDLEFESAKMRAAWITPVPGGVGPMTVATLLQNTLSAYKAANLNPHAQESQENKK